MTRPGRFDIAVQLLEHIRHDVVDRHRLIEVRDHDHELIAAEPRDDVAVTYAGAHAARDLGQQLVADVVTERVVHMLEAIQVDQHHGATRIGLGSPCQNLVQSAPESQPVGEPGERIVIGEKGDFPFRAPQFLAYLDLLGDVGLDADPAAQFPARHRAAGAHRCRATTPGRPCRAPGSRSGCRAARRMIRGRAPPCRDRCARNTAARWCSARWLPRRYSRSGA